MPYFYNNQKGLPKKVKWGYLSPFMHSITWIGSLSSLGWFGLLILEGGPNYG